MQKMQDLSMYSQINPQFPELEHLKCPRCDSANTKFCYYNNYNLSQPRHYCKNCRRYWTKGGTLRNIPVGGGSRKNSTKRSSSSTKRSSSATSSAAPAVTPSSSTSSPTVSAAPNSSYSSPATTPQPAPKTEPQGTSLPPPAFGQHRPTMTIDTDEGQYGHFFQGLNQNGSNSQLYGFGEHDLNRGAAGPGTVSYSGQHGEPGNDNSEDLFLNGYKWLA